MATPAAAMTASTSACCIHSGTARMISRTLISEDLPPFELRLVKALPCVLGRSGICCLNSMGKVERPVAYRCWKWGMERDRDHLQHEAERARRWAVSIPDPLDRERHPARWPCRRDAAAALHARARPGKAVPLPRVRSEGQRVAVDQVGQSIAARRTTCPWSVGTYRRPFRLGPSGSPKLHRAGFFEDRSQGAPPLQLGPGRPSAKRAR